MESMVLSSLSFRVNLPTTFTFLSVFEQILRLPACIRAEACFMAVGSSAHHSVLAPAISGLSRICSLP